MHHLRGPVITTVALLLFAGCGGGSGDRRAVAAAKCSAPVASKLDPADPIQVQIQAVDTQVTDLGGGRFRVTGSASLIGSGQYSFACVVVPDPSDKLRGFRVVELQIDQ